MLSCLGSEKRLNNVRLSRAVKVGHVSAVESKAMQNKDSSKHAFR